MNRRRISLALALTAVFILAAIGWFVPLSRRSEAAPAPSGDAAFKGKVLIVNTTANFMIPSFLLEKAQVQKLGDHTFLVGKGAADDKVRGWYKGQTVRPQMEHILSVIEFDDLKDARKALESGGGIMVGPAALEGAPLVPAGEALPSSDRPKKEP